MAIKKYEIGKFLIKNNFINESILKAALDYQAKYGGNVIQYLIVHDYVNEEIIAKCIAQQFGYPYLPLKGYEIRPQIIKLVSCEIAEKYWLIPIDRMGDILTIAMVDPLDLKAIREVENATGCKVQTFVSILSDITKAIDRHYNMVIEDGGMVADGKAVPLFVTTNHYKGIENRRSIRMDAAIEIHFPEQDRYEKSEIKDVGMHGFRFESNNMLPIGSYVVLEINLPEEFSPYPIAAVVQVVRVTPIGDKRFDIGANTVNISKKDADIVMRYVSMKNK